MLLTGYRLRLVRPDCNHSAETVNAIAELEDDVGAVFPYLNATVRGGRYSPRAPAFAFRHEGHRIVLRPREAAISAVEDEAEARRVLHWLAEAVNRAWDGHDEIEPDYAPAREVRLVDVYRLLPGGNCRQCGQPTCLAFAAMLVRDEVTADACRPLLAEVNALKREQLSVLLRG